MSKVICDEPFLRESASERPTLPAPRLQFRWVPYQPETGNERVFGYDWACYYELVLPLGEHDIRREVYKDGEQVGERHELVLPFPGFTKVGRGGSSKPCEDGRPDTPFRDGAHAKWDSEALGGLPVFVIAPDGTPLPVERKNGSSPPTSTDPST